MILRSTRASLLSRLRSTGDDAAWSEFEDRYEEMIFRYCRRRGVSTEDAEDIHQLVLMRLMQALPRFQYDPARGRFHNYLLRVVGSAIADMRRCPGFRDFSVQDNEWLDRVIATETDASDDVWEQEWLNHHLRRALATVRTEVEPRSVEVFESMLGGSTCGDAAIKFGISEEAAKKIRQRLRQRVQERIMLQIEEENTVE